MASSFWIGQEKKFLKAIKNVEVPNSNLDNVDSIIIKTPNNIDKIPDGGGCYWIWTNEPVMHTLHKHKLPPKIKNGEIIYNGIAKDDVKGRIRHHLFGQENAGWSGISLDIYKETTTSHRKKAMSDKGKVPYIVTIEQARRRNIKKGIEIGDSIEKYSPIRNKELLLKLHLDNPEKRHIKSTDNEIYYFRNGINVSLKKHKSHRFRVYYIIGLSSPYLEYIEKMWRNNGLPRLCSYSTGR